MTVLDNADFQIPTAITNKWGELEFALEQISAFLLALNTHGINKSYLVNALTRPQTVNMIASITINATDRVISVVSAASPGALTSTLPLEADLNQGDNHEWLDESGNFGDYNHTILFNSNEVMFNGTLLKAASPTIWHINTVADVSDSLDGTYFKLEDDSGTVGFWIDTDDSGTTIPAGASACDRAVEITTIATDDTAATIAGLLETAIHADSKFSASSSGTRTIVTSSTNGNYQDVSNGDTGFTINLKQLGAISLVINADGGKLVLKYVAAGYYVMSSYQDVIFV